MAQKVAFGLGFVEVSVREATPAETATFAQDPTGEREAAREFVAYALSIGAIKFEPEYPDKWFQTKIGRHSPYFFNSGLFCSARDLYEMAQAYLAVVEAHLTEEELPDVIYGPAYKGIQIADGLASALFDLNDYNPGVAFNRKEAKDHGEGGLLVGANMQGRRVLLVDDVITSGKSKHEALGFIRGAGGVPIGCVIAFDRQEVGEDGTLSAAQEFTQMTGLPIYAAATLDDLIRELEEGPAVPGGAEALPHILAYKDQYGV
jgi:orotate phosphoribosyltransferase